MVEHDALEKKYCKLVFDTEWLKRNLTSTSIGHVAHSCIYHRKYYGEYNRAIYEELLRILDGIFSNSHISVVPMPLRISIGDHTIKEVYGKEDFFHVEISYKKGSIKIPQGGNALQKDTAFFNEVNLLIPKEIKRAVGFVSL